MSGYAVNANQSDIFWGPETQASAETQQQYSNEYNSFQNQNFEFQSFGEQVQYSNMGSKSYQDLNTLNPLIPDTYQTDAYDYTQEDTNFDDEPPLLEELEIYPERILEKMIIALLPFRDHRLSDDAEFLTKGNDLAGPVAFCILLAISLFISGSKVYFGYIYGLSVMSCLVMFGLLTLMTTDNVFTLIGVTSILGYCLFPIVALSILGVFVSLHGAFGTIISALAVAWSSLSASRLLTAVSGDADQRPLVAYPCALVCGVFALLVLF